MSDESGRDDVGGGGYVGGGMGARDHSLTWRTNNASSTWIFLEITCWYWPLGFSKI